MAGREGEGGGGGGGGGDGNNCPKCFYEVENSSSTFCEVCGFKLWSGGAGGAGDTVDGKVGETR